MLMVVHFPENSHLHRHLKYRPTVLSAKLNYVSTVLSYAAQICLVHPAYRAQFSIGAELLKWMVSGRNWSSNCVM